MGRGRCAGRRPAEQVALLEHPYGWGWALRLAGELGATDARAPLLERAAGVHAHEALRQLTDSGYGGEHWLASFAVYLLTDVRPASR